MRVDGERPATWRPTVLPRAAARGQETDVDARVDVDAMLVTTIFGGTSEIMKTIIARDLTGLRA